MVDVFRREEVQHVDATLRSVGRILDGNPHQRFADHTRAFGQITLLFQGRAEERYGYHSFRHRFL